MTEQKVSLRYARALFDTAKITESIDTVYNDFLLISQYFVISKELSVVLRSPIIQNWKKKQLMTELFQKNVSELTYNFLLLLTEKQRESFLIDIISYYERLYLADKNTIKAYITSAREIDDSLKNKIVSEFENKLSKKIIPNFKIDPAIKGGITVRVDDWVYDASVRNQLNQLKNKLIEDMLVLN